MGRLWRVHHPDLPADSGALVRLDAEESHHVSRVLRRKPGDRVGVFDGRGTEWSAVVVSVGRGGVELRLEARLDDPVETPVRIEVYQALCRSERMEWLIQKSTELGVAAFHPLVTERAEAKRPSATKLSRWRRIAVESCKQSGRRILPSIEPSPELPPPARGALAILLDTGERAVPLGELLARREPGAVWVAVGPESGWTESEVDRWTSRGWESSGLGPRVLRTETAGIVAVAIVQNTWGDVGRKSG